jgi:hypothetical protein
VSELTKHKIMDINNTFGAFWDVMHIKKNPFLGAEPTHPAEQTTHLETHTHYYMGIDSWQLGFRASAVDNKYDYFDYLH